MPVHGCTPPPLPPPVRPGQRHLRAVALAQRLEVGGGAHHVPIVCDGDTALEVPLVHELVGVAEPVLVVHGVRVPVREPQRVPHHLHLRERQGEVRAALQVREEVAEGVALGVAAVHLHVAADGEDAAGLVAPLSVVVRVEAWERGGGGLCLRGGGGWDPKVCAPKRPNQIFPTANLLLMVKQVNPVT